MAQQLSPRNPARARNKSGESRSGSAPPIEIASGLNSSLADLLLAKGMTNLMTKDKHGPDYNAASDFPVTHSDSVDNAFGPAYCCDLEASGHSPDGVSFLMSTMSKQSAMARERSLSNSFSDGDIAHMLDNLSSSPSTLHSHAKISFDRNSHDSVLPQHVNPVVMTPATSNDYFAHETNLVWDDDEDEDVIDRKPLVSSSPMTDATTTSKHSTPCVPDLLVPFANHGHTSALSSHNADPSSSRSNHPTGCSSTSPVLPILPVVDERYASIDQWRSHSAPPIQSLPPFQQQQGGLPTEFFMQANQMVMPFMMVNQTNSFAVSPLYPFPSQPYHHQQQPVRGGGKDKRGGRGRGRNGGDYDHNRRMRNSDVYDFYPGNDNEPDDASVSSWSMGQSSPSSQSSGATRHVTSAGGESDRMLEEFKNSSGKSRIWTLNDIFGHVAEFCKDQHGSRFIQQQLESCSSVDKYRVFDEVVAHGGDLISDVFGNYVVQKLLELGTSKHQIAIAELITGRVVSLSLQMYGCRVVQKVMDVVDEVTLCVLVAEVRNSIMMSVYDQNGNHVIQKSIAMLCKATRSNLPRDLMEKIFSSLSLMILGMVGHIREMSLHPYGCRVVQRVLEHCAQEFKYQIVLEVRQSVGELMFDQFGNYVIQHMMSFGTPEDKSFLVQQVMSNLIGCAQHKFASNVVEKCLVYSSTEDKNLLISAVLRGHVDPSRYDISRQGYSQQPRVLDVLIRDQFGNYVVQRLMEVANEEHQADLIRYVKENHSNLRKYTYGKHIIGRAEKFVR